MMNNIIAWLRRNSDRIEYTDAECFYSVYLGHQIRLTPDGVFAVGYRDFDRWANSVAHETTIDPYNIQCHVNMAIEFARRNPNDPDWHHTMKLIDYIFN